MSATATAAVSKAGAVKKDSVPEIIAASMVGTAIEFYDNYCYSIAAASYFGTIFSRPHRRPIRRWARCTRS